MVRKRKTDDPIEAPAAQAQTEAATPVEAPAANGPSTDGERTPAEEFSYPVSRDAWVHVSVWERPVRLSDGASFTAYDISVRKRYKDRQTGEMKAVYSFHSSEVYAVVHALTKAAGWVIETRATSERCPS